MEEMYQSGVVCDAKSSRENEAGVQSPCLSSSALSFQLSPTEMQLYYSALHEKNVFHKILGKTSRASENVCGRVDFDID